MNPYRLPLIVKALLGASFMVANVRALASCTTCALGNDLITDANPCNNLEDNVNGLFNTDLDCKNAQLEHYQKGCCPLPPLEDHCGYCADGFSTPNMELMVPTGQIVGGYACFDYYYQPQSRIGMFTDGDCSDTFLQRAGFYCGCPNQEQECWLCPDGQPPSKPAKGDAWVTKATCRGIEYLFSLFKEDECAAFPYEAGADLAIFCGCGGLNQTEIDAQAEIYQCNLCENGGVVTNPDFPYSTEGDFVKTCAQAEEFAREIIKTPSGCRNPRHFGEARQKCTCSEPLFDTSPGAPSLMVSWTPLLLQLLIGMVVIAHP
ncbi:unnamed protein product [Pseudo-nitzschia multistriata]|uniref:Uncharacterized protein n=1 Tax=Pseudo-nitzschia multistriata TaxID=183589 RepID=A0A448ZNE5_9STRA|nr:unnamed protein product [Pseudo-nitzschia multistriata]